MSESTEHKKASPEDIEPCVNEVLHTESCVDPEWEESRWYRGASLRILLAGLSAVLIIFIALITSPKAFPKATLVKIESGWSIAQASEYLEEKEIVRSGLLLKTIIRFTDKGSGVIAGDYFFEKPISVLDVAERVVTGEFGLDPILVFIPEGSTTFEIAKLFGDEFSEFDPVEFLALSEGKEGYLFPDTYFFLPNVEAEQVITVMEENFYARVASLQDKIIAFGKPLHDVVTMASLIEKEAWKSHDRRKISGVLWNRIEIDMPLQVDAVFPYIIGKNTYEVSLKDLQVDSPYNTYRYKGLPIGPIANPSLDSIEAAVTPEPSEYLFYLADRNGNTYYARTFEEHKQNRWRYMN